MSDKAVEKESILNELKSKFGIAIGKNSSSVEDLKRDGFRQINVDRISKYTDVLKYIPQLIARSAEHKSAQDSFSRGIQGSYKIDIPPGSILFPSRKDPTGFIGSFHGETDTKVSGHAIWHENDSKFEISDVPQLALGFFNFASMATSQYFMSQINGKLEEIKNGINAIKEYLDIERKSDFESVYHEFIDIENAFGSIASNHDRTQLELGRLKEIQHGARRSFISSKEHIKNIVAIDVKKDKEKEVNLKILTFGDYIMELQESLHLFCAAKLYEAILIGDNREESLNEYLKMIENWIAIYDRICAASKKYFFEYLEVNKRGTIQDNFDLAFQFFYPLGNALLSMNGFRANKCSIDVHMLDRYKDNIEKNKAEKINQILDYMQNTDRETLKTSVVALQNYMNLFNKPISIVLSNGQYYMNA